MRKIADTNYIQNERLVSEYLSHSPTNQIVLTDYMAVELFNSGNVETLHRATRILVDYPKQVLVLKDIGKVCRLSGRSSGLQRRLVDEEQTRYLPKLFREVSLAAKGDQELIAAHRQMEIQAKQQLELVYGGALDFKNAYDEIASRFTASELKALRQPGDAPLAVIPKVREFAEALALDIYADDEYVRYAPRPDELKNTYIFRAALCCSAMALWWVRKGGVGKTGTETIRNDMVDCYIAAYATYFDGVLSRDSKLCETYKLSRRVLSQLCC